MLLLFTRPRSAPRSLAHEARRRGAILAGRVAGRASQLLGRGGGTALPGLVAGRIAPDLLESIALASERTVLVTGTNGKTTTAHLLVAAARNAGLEVMANPSGSNLERGLVGALVAASGPGGELPEPAGRVAVLEVDEATTAAVLPRLHPTVAVFLNLFRDQLDRYGEIDSIARGWRHALEADGGGPTLVLNADDPSIAQLADGARGRVVTFGVEDPTVGLPAAEHASDARFCSCGGTFEYGARYIAHVGAWRCRACGRARPPLDVAARNVRLDEGSTRFDLTTAAGTVAMTLPVAGLYSVYNALAAAAAALALGLPSEPAERALREAGPAFGRQERFVVRGRQVRMLLAKNPAGLNEIVRTLNLGSGPVHVLWLLNDGIQDGRDVSWIYDADLEALSGRCALVVASGTRADDLALRLHLAGLDPHVVEGDIDAALAAALDRTPEGARLDVVTTYTAMLEARARLADWTHVRQYWMAPA